MGLICHETDDTSNRRAVKFADVLPGERDRAVRDSGGLVNGDRGGAEKVTR
jgi:hypothetical protein